MQLSVLVIDDDVEIREFLKDFLEGEGYFVTLLADPTQALELLKEDLFHVVVLDLMMPELHGIDLLAQIRDHDDDIAVIILTGHPSLQSATTSIELEVSAYIRKPFTPQEFREAITRIAKKKNLQLSREQELHEIIGLKLRTLRKQKNLTLKQMARRTELSVSLISQIERASATVSIASLYKLACALDVRLTDFFVNF